MRTVTRTAPAYSRAAAFDSRLGRNGSRRAVVGRLAIGVGAVTATGLMGGCATVVAAWMVANSLGGHPTLHATVFAVPPANLARPYHRLASAVDGIGAIGLPASSIDSGSTAPPAAIAPRAPAPADSRADSTGSIGGVTTVAETAPLPQPSHRAAPARSLPAYDADLMPKRIHVEVIRMPARQTVAVPREQAAAPTEHAHAPVNPAGAAPAQSGPAAAPKVASLTPPPAMKPLPERLTPQGHDEPLAVPPPDAHTAIYDIAAHTVYMPNGEKLEAHSGVGYRLDNPRYVKEKARGPTPPNVYTLTLRGSLFHGVRAIRLNPVHEEKMFGRDGILAHTYMLGPSGQSFGCVSFRNYPQFLHAFLRGDVNRMIVVPHLDRNPVADARAAREPDRKYAQNASH